MTTDPVKALAGALRDVLESGSRRVRSQSPLVKQSAENLKEELARRG